MDFQERLHKAAERGHMQKQQRASEAAAEAMSEEECKRLYSQYRLTIADHIETCLKQLADFYPGFKFETIVGESGWGASVNRDDVNLSRGTRGSLYSRLEIVIPPFNKYHVFNIAAKGTIRNKEIFNRNHFEPLSETDIDTFGEMIDRWVLEYAEQFSAV